MSDKTAISWTDATFNPWWGCTKVSPACDNCYAERDAKRFAPGRVLWGLGTERRIFGDAHWQAPLKWAKSMPAKLGRRPRVFCASMADVFDKDAPEQERARLWRLIHETPQLDWLLLTKRIGNAHRMLPPEWVDPLVPRMPDNVWIGATVINQEEADRDIPKLLELPARVRFLSIEPMLGPMDLRYINWHTTGEIGDGNRWALNLNALTGFRATSQNSGVDGHRVDWVIAGGESGPQARPAHPGWFRSLSDQCAAAGVPFHFKQWGEWTATGPIDATRCSVDLRGRVADGALRQNFPPDAESGDGWRAMYRAGKAAAGRLLDGVEHNGFPA